MEWLLLGTIGGLAWWRQRADVGDESDDDASPTRRDCTEDFVAGEPWRAPPVSAAETDAANDAVRAAVKALPQVPMTDAQLADWIRPLSAEARAPLPETRVNDGGSTMGPVRLRTWHDATVPGLAETAYDGRSAAAFQAQFQRPDRSGRDRRGELFQAVERIDKPGGWDLHGAAPESQAPCHLDRFAMNTSQYNKEAPTRGQVRVGPGIGFGMAEVNTGVGPRHDPFRALPHMPVQRNNLVGRAAPPDIVYTTAGGKDQRLINKETKNKGIKTFGLAYRGAQSAQGVLGAPADILLDFKASNVEALRPAKQRDDDYAVGQSGRGVSGFAGAWDPAPLAHPDRATVQPEGVYRDKTTDAPAGPAVGLPGQSRAADAVFVGTFRAPLAVDGRPVAAPGFQGPGATTQVPGPGARTAIKDLGLGTAPFRADVPAGVAAGGLPAPQAAGWDPGHGARGTAKDSSVDRPGAGVSRDAPAAGPIPFHTLDDRGHDGTAWGRPGTELSRTTEEPAGPVPFHTLDERGHDAQAWGRPGTELSRAAEAPAGPVPFHTLDERGHDGQWLGRAAGPVQPRDGTEARVKPFDAPWAPRAQTGLESLPAGAQAGARTAGAEVQGPAPWSEDAVQSGTQRVNIDLEGRPVVGPRAATDAGPRAPAVAQTRAEGVRNGDRAPVGAAPGVVAGGAPAAGPASTDAVEFNRSGRGELVAVAQAPAGRVAADGVAGATQWQDVEVTNLRDRRESPASWSAPGLHQGQHNAAEPNSEPGVSPGTYGPGLGTRQRRAQDPGLPGNIEGFGNMPPETSGGPGRRYVHVATGHAPLGPEQFDLERRPRRG